MRRSDICVYLGPADRAELQALLSNRNTPRKLAGFGVAALLLSVTLLGEALTKFGTTHWQTSAEMKRNGFFAKPGGGFLLGKLGPPKSKRPFLVSMSRCL